MTAILKIGMTFRTLRGVVWFGWNLVGWRKVRCHANDDNQVKIDTGNSDISAVDWDISSKLDFDFLKRVSSNTKLKVDLRLHEYPPIWKSTRRHNSAVNGSIWMVCTPMQNNTPMTKKIDQNRETRRTVPIWQPSCFESGSSYISAVDWHISSKFGMLIDFWPSFSYLVRAGIP